MDILALPIEPDTVAGRDEGALGNARRLVAAARSGREDGEARTALATMTPTGLAAELADDLARTAFWLNVYNAGVRARLLADPASYRHRWRFFTSPAVRVAGRALSPTAIEHGLLRRSAYIAGLGYVHNPWPGDYERQLRVERPDARIHFALNCGARSCPPLASWSAEDLDPDLERAAASYLAGETRRAPDGTVLVPRLLLWYRGDFGGGRGVRALLRRHGLVGAEESPRIRYAPYDWTMDIGGDDTTR